MSNDSGPVQPATDNNGSSSAEGAPSEDSNAQELRQRRYATQIKRKADFINNVMFNLDLLIYAELCALYYMDCNFFRFLVRALFQVMFLTPKPKFVPPAPKHRPYIGAIFGGNIMCILLHIFTHRPEAGELTRGYLHGGLIIDFIGQQGPVSKLHLVAIDFLVMALQLFMLAVHVEETKLAEILKSPAASLNIDSRVLPVNTAQDHDAEERGVHRNVAASSEDIEMQEMPSERGDSEREQLLSQNTGGAREDPIGGPLDLFYSGNAIVGEFHVIHTLRTQWEDYDSATSTAIQNVGFSANYHFTRASHQLRRLERLQQG